MDGSVRRPSITRSCGKRARKGNLFTPDGSHGTQAARLRKGGRAVECTGLENRQERKLFVGSNPTPSARQTKGPRRGPFLVWPWVGLQNPRSVGSTHRQDSRCAQPHSC